jgi:beta-galactosidase
MVVQRPVPAGQVESVTRWGWSDELQSWTWPGSEGEPLRVRVFSSADRVELRLNGAVIGTKELTAKDKRIAEFSVPYATGVLEAVGYRGGAVLARKRIETVGKPARLRVAAERPKAGRGRDRVSFVTVEVLDAQGRLVPDATIKLRAKVNGPAELVGFGSANPLAVGSFQSAEAQSFQGRALVILRAKGEVGVVGVEVSGDGLAAVLATLSLA